MQVAPGARRVTSPGSGRASRLTILLILVVVAALLAIAQRISVPYPILLVVGGALLGLVPGVPSLELPPEAVLLGVLPPLLFYAGYLSSFRELKENARPLTLLAIGLVLLTAAAVAVLAHMVLGLDWALAFTLGAVLSPTDPVAATSIAAVSARRTAPSGCSRARAWSTTPGHSCCTGWRWPPWSRASSARARRCWSSPGVR